MVGSMTEAYVHNFVCAGCERATGVGRSYIIWIEILSSSPVLPVWYERPYVVVKGYITWSLIKPHYFLRLENKLVVGGLWYVAQIIG